MELAHFVKTFSEQFDETESVVFTPETKFKDLDEWSSLLAMCIIAMVDDDYGVAIKGDDIRSAETIADLYNIVKSKNNV